MYYEEISRTEYVAEYIEVNELVDAVGLVITQEEMNELRTSGWERNYRTCDTTILANRAAIKRDLLSLQHAAKTEGKKSFVISNELKAGLEALPKTSGNRLSNIIKDSARSGNIIRYVNPKTKQKNLDVIKKKDVASFIDACMYITNRKLQSPCYFTCKYSYSDLLNAAVLAKKLVTLGEILALKNWSPELINKFVKIYNDTEKHCTFNK